MAANSIGNASLRLSASGGDLAAGLAKAGQGIKAWGDKTQAAVAGAVTGVAGKVVGGLSNAKALLSGAGAAIGTYLGGPIGTAIGGAVGTAAGGIVETIFGAITEPLERLNVFGGLTKQAASLGIASSQFAGLTQQMSKFGIEGNEVNATFAKLGKKVSEAKSGNADAAASFAKLGLNAQQLASLPLDEQFLSVADAIAKLPPGGEQAAAAMKLFEDAGVKMLPMLQKGKAGIQEFIEAQKKTGAVLSDSQYKAAADAAKAWKESKQAISSVWDGLVNRATLIAAPIVKFIGGAVQKVYALLTPVFEWLGRAIGKAAEIMEAVGEVLIGWFEEACTWVKEFADEWLNLGDGAMSIESVVLAVLKNVAMGLGYVWDTLKAGAGIVAVVVGAFVEGFGQIVVRFKDTVKGLLELAGELPDSLGGAMFRNAAGRVEEMGQKIQGAGKGLQAWGVGAVDAWGTSAGKIGSWFDKLSGKRKEEEKAAAKLDEELKAAPYKAVASAVKGSKEAYSIEAKFRWDSQNKKVEEKQLDEQKKANVKLDKVINILGISIPLVAG